MRLTIRHFRKISNTISTTTTPTNQSYLSPTYMLRSTGLPRYNPTTHYWQAVFVCLHCKNIKQTSYRAGLKYPHIYHISYFLHLHTRFPFLQLYARHICVYVALGAPSENILYYKSSFPGMHLAMLCSGALTLH